MKEFKKNKRRVNFKRGATDIVFWILPYIPMLAMIVVINILFESKFYDETLKVLATVGTIFVSWKAWRYTNKLCEVVDNIITKKRESQKIEDNMEVDEE